MIYEKIRVWINKSRFWIQPKRIKIMLVAGFMIVAIIILLAIFADFISPFNPYETNADSVLKPPGEGHLLGTDSVGRDIYSRCLLGLRISLLIGFGATLLASSVGSILGVISGYFGGTLDKAISLPMDALWAFPSFITALLVSVILGPAIQNLATALAIGWISSYYRNVRSRVISLKEESFVYAEITMGASSPYIIFHHILPLCFSVIIVLMTMGIAHAVISAAGLGFLGLGIPPPTPELGADIAQGKNVLTRGAWWPTIGPVIFVFLMILGFNLVGESLNRLLGTRLEET